MRQPRKLVGFGVSGWVALAVLAGAACLVVWASRSPIDALQPRYAILSWVTDAFGWEAMYGVSLSILYTGFFLSASSLSWATLLLLLPAFFVAARPYPWVTVGLLTVSCLCLPIMCGFGGPHLGRILPSAWLTWLPIDQSTLEPALVGLGAGILLIVYSRSLTVSIAVLVAFGVSLASEWLLRFGVIVISDFIYLSVGNVSWNVLMVIPIYVWAIRTRRPYWDDRLCRTCGYDVSGVTGGVCPECGASIEVRPGRTKASRKQGGT